MPVSRTEVLRRTSERSGIPAVHLETAVRAVLETIAESLADGRAVQFKRFGTFEPRLRPAIVRPNPQTGLPMDIPDRLSVAFLPSVTLKTKMNGRKS